MKPFITKVLIPVFSVRFWLKLPHMAVHREENKQTKFVEEACEYTLLCDNHGQGCTVQTCTHNMNDMQQ